MIATALGFVIRQTAHITLIATALGFVIRPPGHITLIATALGFVIRQPGYMTLIATALGFSETNKHFFLFTSHHCTPSIQAYMYVQTDIMYSATLKRVIRDK